MALLAGKAGSVFSNTLHTGGAIAFLAGLVIYIAWARGARRGDTHTGLLKAGMVTTYLAVLTNLFGGFVRTYAPGHPGLSEALDEPWALIMVLKHAFLFAGMFAAVYLYEVVAPRIRRRIDAGGALPVSRKESLAVGLVAGGIFIATVLGAVAGVTTIGPDPLDGGSQGNQADNVSAPSDPSGLLLEDAYYNFTGSLTSVPPLSPGQSQGTFNVPGNTGRLEAVLTWQDDVAALDVALDRPATRTPSAQQVVLVIEDPESGSIDFTVTGENAINVPWTLAVRLTPADDGQDVIAGQFTIAPGSQVNLFEINTQMDLHANVSWTWTIAEGLDSPFNVHTHFDGEVQYLVEETSTAGEGRITAHRTGGYSWMWENENPVPITVEYRLWGQFTVDSYFPPQSTSSKLLG